MLMKDKYDFLSMASEAFAHRFRYLVEVTLTRQQAKGSVEGI